MGGAKKKAAMAHRTGAQSDKMLCTASAFGDVVMLTMLPSFISNFFSLLTVNGVPRWAHCSLQERHAPVIIGRTWAWELSSLTETTNALCIISYVPYSNAPLSRLMVTGVLFFAYHGRNSLSSSAVIAGQSSVGVGFALCIVCFSSSVRGGSFFSSSKVITVIVFIGLLLGRFPRRDYADVLIPLRVDNKKDAVHLANIYRPSITAESAVSPYSKYITKSAKSHLPPTQKIGKSSRHFGNFSIEIKE